MNQDELNEPASRRKILMFVVIGLLLILFWHSARTGYAALLTAGSLKTRDLRAATTAVNLSPGNANAHLVLGALLEAKSDRAAALAHYQTAVKLRPEDYVLWLQLARGQELAGNSEGAINSGRVAVGLAPFYAQPHWQLGNILVRAGRTDGGFSELRMAAASDLTLLPSIIDLAWQMSGGKVEYVIQAIQPGTPAAYKAMADYFKKRGEVETAIAMLVAGSSALEQERRAYIGELISARRFADARRLWGVKHPSDPDGPLMFDPGFEEETDLDEPGFGWRANNLGPTLTLSLDNADPKEGHSSLRVDFNGESNPNAPIISQLKLVGMKQRYQLSLAYRTENLVSGGLPTIFILDASDNKVLGQTDALPQTTRDWQRTTIDFTTGDSTSAVQITLQRKPCPTQQCPIFGKLWLDNFFLDGPGIYSRPAP